MCPQPNLKPAFLVLCGPTASGKTAAAIALAGKIGAEVVSVDSGQIYRGLNIGTAKPAMNERSGIPFHLLDVVDPSESFSAAEFRKLALAAIEGIQKRGRHVVMTVGTGLYLKALEEGLFEGPGADPVLRAELERRIEKEGIESLEEELHRVDPVAAKSITKGNRQRVVRALEVYHLTGRPISEHWEKHSKNPPLKKGGRGDFQKFGLDVPKDELNRRIEARVEEMIEQGLLAEVRDLLKTWGPDAPGLKLIGYKEIAAYLRQETTLEEAVTLTIRRTRRYAKRQRTWFKKDQEIQWFSSSRELIQHLTK